MGLAEHGRGYPSSGRKTTDLPPPPRGPATTAGIAAGNITGAGTKRDPYVLEDTEYMPDPEHASAPGPATMTLTEFLLARLDEDEGQADHRGQPIGDFRVADVKAKRRIVAWVQAQHRAAPHMSEWADMPLRYLAAAYHNHPDYRDQWRP